MRHIIWKNFAAWNFDKEEAWLNDMSAKGLALVNPGIVRYTFEESIPGEYIYRIGFLDKRPKDPESMTYIRFMEESGLQHIGSVNHRVYFQRKVSDGGFELFNDIDSRLRHLRKIFKLNFSGMLLDLLLTANEVAMIVTIKVNIPGMHIAGTYIAVALFLFLMFCLTLYGTIKIGTKINTLKRERRIHE